MDFNQIASTLEALRFSPPSMLVLLEGADLRSAHVPPFPPDRPALLTGVDSRTLAEKIKSVLLTAFPQDHLISTVCAGVKQDMQLKELGMEFPVPADIYVHPLERGSSFESFAEIVAHLRAPDGCPWDREQTHQTLRTHLLEETYEALASMDSLDAEAMTEEFGDLLLQIVLNAQIGAESGEFTIFQVIRRIHDKIIRRHPHVFGDLKLDGVKGVLQNWERLKETERSDAKVSKGLLDGVPPALPALSQAQEYQDRAARVGFDWPEIEGVLEKIREEVEEIRLAENLEEITNELGDLFFVLVNLARWREVDAESALRGANLKFKNRFSYVESGARSKERPLSDLTLEEMDSLWNEAKAKGM
jgi:tetrapyrrole methylase family protein/MazG family protein